MAAQELLHPGYGAMHALAGATGITAVQQGFLEHRFRQVEDGVMQHPFRECCGMDQTAFRVVDHERPVLAQRRRAVRDAGAERLKAGGQIGQKSRHIRALPFAPRRLVRSQ